VIDVLEDVTYTIIVVNSGDVPAAVSLVDHPPLPYKAGSASGGIWWDDGVGAMRWEGSLAVYESRVFTFAVHGPLQSVPSNTVYTNEVSISDGVHPPVIRSVSVLANPSPTATSTPTDTATATPSPPATFTPTATQVATSRVLYLPLVLSGADAVPSSAETS